ncbi:hypothetical protein ACHAO8_003835 [Botrytis cinerea]
MSELQEDVDMMNDPLLKKALDENNYELLVPNLEELNTLFSGMKSKYETLQADAEHSENVVILLRRIMKDVQTLTKDKVLAKKYIEMLNKKYEELKATEEATKISGETAQQQKEQLSRRILSNDEAAKKKENELSVRIKNVSVGSDVRKAFSDLLNAFQELSLSNKETAEKIIESNTESINKVLDLSKASINGVLDSSKTSINDVVESSKASIIGASDSSKASINDVVKSSKNLLNNLADSSKSSIIEVVKSSTAYMQKLSDSSNQSINETVEHANKSIENSKSSIQQEVKNIEESVKAASSVIDEGVKSVAKTINDASNTLVSSMDKVKTSLEEKTKISIDEFASSAKATVSDNVKLSNDEFLMSVKVAIGKAIKTGRASGGKERKILDQADEIERLLNLVKSHETKISTLFAENENLKRAGDTLLNEKNSMQLQLDAEKSSLTRVTREKNILEVDKTTLQAEKAELDTRISTLKNDYDSVRNQVSKLTNDKSKVEQGVSKLKTRVSELMNNLDASNNQNATLMESITIRDQKIETLESSLIPRDDLTKQITEKTQMVEQLQSYNYEKRLEAQKASDEAYQKVNQDYLDEIMKSYENHLNSVEKKHTSHMEKFRDCQNKFVQGLMNVVTVPKAPCPSCAQHEAENASLKRDLLEKNSKVETLRDQIGTIKEAITSQTELVKLRSTLDEDIKLFKKKKEMREKALVSMTKGRDHWCDMHQRLSTQHSKELKDLELEHSERTLKFENKVRELNLATEKLKEDNAKVHEDLIKSHNLAIESKEKEIKLIASEIDSIKKMKPGTPVSPTVPEASLISEGSATKKRNHEIFSGSPQSKFIRAWHKYCSDMFAIVDKMVPEGVPNVSVGFCRISQCFVSEDCIKIFNDFENINENKWFCLSSMLVIGLSRCPKIGADTSTCRICKGGEESCLQVRNFGSIITFRIVASSTM